MFLLHFAVFHLFNLLHEDHMHFTNIHFLLLDAAKNNCITRTTAVSLHCKHSLCSLHSFPLCNLKHTHFFTVPVLMMSPKQMLPDPQNPSACSVVISEFYVNLFCSEWWTVENVHGRFLNEFHPVYTSKPQSLDNVYLVPIKRWDHRQ